ncbi:MAG: cytochrome P450 [Sphingobium sp.]
MTTLVERDYFSDHSILRDPYAYFEALREHGPVYRDPRTGVVTITGFAEAVEVLNDSRNWSSLISTTGAGKELPFTPQGSDISAQIEANRDKFQGGDLVVTYDDQMHSKTRALLSKLFTPSRLKANEQFIAEYSEDLVGKAVANGGVELIKQIATPFVTLVVADLLGVPADDRQLFMDAIEAAPPPGNLDDEDYPLDLHPLFVMGQYFAGYVVDRRETPRDDVLTELSLATFPDGTMPDAMEIVRIATFLFGAGQDTSAKLLGNAMRVIAEQPELQDQLRANPSLIPALLEEVLRLEGSTKITSRIARKDTAIAGIPMAAGTRVLIGLSAANRDPRRWDNPQELILNRPRIKEHLGFGRGAHVCIGAPLARVEVRVILEKFLEHTSKIEIDESVHGPAGNRTLEYEPSFIIRGLAEMHLKLTPAENFSAPVADVSNDKEAKPKRGIFGFGRKANNDPAEPTRYSVAGTKLNVLLSDPAAKSILDKHFPGFTTDKRIGMAKGMTLKAIQKFAPDFFSADALAVVDQELGKLSAG